MCTGMYSILVCVCIPRCVSTVLTALMKRGLLDSEYSTKTIRSFRDVFTTRRDCRWAHTHRHYVARHHNTADWSAFLNDKHFNSSKLIKLIRSLLMTWTHQASCQSVEPLQCLTVMNHTIHPIHKQHDLTESWETDRWRDRDSETERERGRQREAERQKEGETGRETDWK